MSPGGQTTPPPYRGWLSDHHARRSDRQDLRCSFDACFIDFGRPPCGAHDFDCAPRNALDSTRTTHDPSVYDYSHTTRGPRALLAPLLTSPTGYARATGTTSTSTVTIGEGPTSGTSGQSSFDDHVGESGFPASTR
jgi:hypothetical protein